MVKVNYSSFPFVISGKWSTFAAQISKNMIKSENERGSVLQSQLLNLQTGIEHFCSMRECKNAGQGVWMPQQVHGTTIVVVDAHTPMDVNLICEKRNVQKWKNETCKKFETWMVKIQVFLCLIMGVFVQKNGDF